MEEKVIYILAELEEPIVDYQSVEGEITKVVYKLQNDQIYYAMVVNGQKLNEQLATFTALTNVELSAEKVKEMLEVILHNCQIYYQLKEYVRYKKYKREDVSVYENSYQTLQQHMLIQFQFLNNFIPLLYGQTSTAFPGLVYQDIPPKEFYLKEADQTSITYHKQRIITEILTVNPTSLTSKDVILSLFPNNEIEMLYQLNFSKMNSDKLGQYIAQKKEALQLLESSEAIDVHVNKLEDPSYNEINTVFDIHTAALISDKVYKKGQGVFAISDYILNGRTVRFTSQYGARDLVLATDYKLYKRLLLQNVLYTYILSYTNQRNSKLEVLYNKLATILEKTDTTLETIVELLANNMLLLTLAVDNFQYEFLNYQSQIIQQVYVTLNQISTQSIGIVLKRLLQELMVK